MTKEQQIYPVILSGGSGTRLWPLSRAALPKQLLALHGKRTMIQETGAARRAPPALGRRCFFAARPTAFSWPSRCRRSASRRVPSCSSRWGRNTAPAAAVAALMTAEEDPQGVIVLLPSDHVVGDAKAFADAVAVAAGAAREGHIVTFGMAPSAPETGYGYVHRGAHLEKLDGAYRVQRFVEKPDADTAKTYLADGGYFWNSGMFVFRADVVIEDLRLHAPDVLAAARATRSPRPSAISISCAWTPMRSPARRTSRSTMR